MKEPAKVSPRAVRGVISRTYGKSGGLRQDPETKLYEIGRMAGVDWLVLGAGSSPGEAAVAALAHHRAELRKAKPGTVTAYAHGRAVTAFEDLLLT